MDVSGIARRIQTRIGRLRQIPTWTIHSTVSVPTLNGIYRLRPLALYPLEVSKALAILKFVDHSRR
jgi:hypothetical protein